MFNQNSQNAREGKKEPLKTCSLGYVGGQPPIPLLGSPTYTHPLRITGPVNGEVLDREVPQPQKQIYLRDVISDKRYPIPSGEAAGHNV